jgi:hypothetical protein
MDQGDFLDYGSDQERRSPCLRSVPLTVFQHCRCARKTLQATWLAVIAVAVEMDYVVGQGTLMMLTTELSVAELL